jgi:hypothetical protein
MMRVIKTGAVALLLTSLAIPAFAQAGYGYGYGFGYGRGYG